jgi:diadenosine tetraphosphate (Ap4A) HIT family hydrolase
MFRYPEHQQKYLDYLAQTKDAGCPFCDQSKSETVEETAHCRVIKNAFPFDIWEGFKVTEHLLLIPKDHIDHLEKLPAESRKDFMDQLCKYEAAGYNLYSRAPQSGARVYPHVHTHLLKTEGELAQSLDYTRHPHTLVVSWE